MSARAILRHNLKSGRIVSSDRHVEWLVSLKQKQNCHGPADRSVVRAQTLSQRRKRTSGREHGIQRPTVLLSDRIRIRDRLYRIG
jgi:hypothetical protein